jgi:quinol monooxygenase YgiN
MVIIQAEVGLGSRADVEKLTAAAREVIELSRAEKGVLVYAFSQDILDPLLVRILECYESESVLKTHLQSAHLQRFMSSLASVNITSLSTKMCDGTNERAPPVPGQ